MPRAQKAILVVAVVLGVTYGWLRGAFLPVGVMNSMSAGPAMTDARYRDDRDALDLASASDSADEFGSLATFAAGCFWSAESAFEGIPGVLSVTAGYTGGTVPNPTYEQVSAGATGHAEAVEVRFDPARVSYEELLDRFWHEVDPFTAHRQFCDLGDQYRPVLFVHDASQSDAAAASREHWEKYFDRPVRVAIEQAGSFYRAETYHQDFASRHPAQYRYYRWSCGRDARLARIWR
jgi:peptide-methionine (S)-S-oxide reductase